MKIEQCTFGRLVRGRMLVAGLVLIAALCFLFGCDSNREVDRPPPAIKAPAESSSPAPGLRPGEKTTTRIKPEEVAGKVAEIVAHQLDVERSKVQPQSRFVNDLGADSLDIVELVMELEETFELSIPDEELSKLKTVGQATQYIQDHLAPR
jgi:acyl carrier protein